MSDTDDLKEFAHPEIIAERGRKYGDMHISLGAAGHAARGVLEAHFQQVLPGPIPPHVMAQMMVVIKACRASVPLEFSEDNYVDAHNYLDIAKKVDPRSKK